MHGLFLLPVLLSLFGPGSCGGSKSTEKEMKLSAVEKSYPHPYCIPHPQLALTGPFGSKNFLGAPYKAYGDDKDLGIGTSGEDSSESSSSKSQRRQAIEDENTRRRYEEGWRKSWHNVAANGSPSQFQPPILDLYGQESERLWTTGRRFYDDSYLTQRHNESTYRRNSDERTTQYRTKYGEHDDLRYFYEPDTQRRRYSDETKRRVSDERRPRRYSPPEGIYRQNPNRSTSQHNLYYPRQPQRSNSQHSLRHMGDMRFP